MKIKALLLMLLVACTGPSFMLEEHTSAGSKYVLPNGMTFILKENHDTGMVAIDVFFGRSIATDGELHGLSHFANRMLLTGTKTRSREDIVNQIENAGGSISVRTYVEFSELLIEIPSESVSVALEILADVILNPAFDEKEFEKERELILGELESKYDQPQVVSEELFMKTLYKDHPYQHPPDGYTEDIEKFTLEQVRNHHNTWTVPGKIIIAIAGNIHEDKAADALAFLFEEMPATQVPNIVVPPNPQLTQERVGEEEIVAESYFIQTGYAITPAVHPDFIPLRVLSAVLGLGSGSRLFYELRDKQALAYSLFTAIPSIRSNGFLKVAMTVRPDVLEKSLAGIELELGRIRQEAVSEEELNQVKQKTRGFFLLDHQRSKDQANYLGFYELQGLGYRHDKAYPDLISQVSAEDVQRVAKKYLTKPATAVVGPFSVTDESLIQ